MKWKISYYNENVYRTLMKWPKKLLGKYLWTVELMEIEGPDLGMPFTRSFGNGLFELRVKAHEGIGRAFFCTAVNKEIVILHNFIKKTQKTPDKELELARKRLVEVREND